MLHALRQARPFAWALLLFQIFLIIVFFIGADYGDVPQGDFATTNNSTTPVVGGDNSIASYYWYVFLG